MCLTPTEVSLALNFSRINIMLDRHRYYEVKDLGITMVDLAPELNISQPAVSMSARRGERIALEKGYSIMDDQKLII
jgi:hypothetical protein